MGQAGGQGFDRPAAGCLEQAGQDAVGHAGQPGDDHRRAGAACEAHMREIAFVTGLQMVAGNIENVGHNRLQISLYEKPRSGSINSLMIDESYPETQILSSQ
jgi:hypothetical protein